MMKGQFKISRMWTAVLLLALALLPPITSSIRTAKGSSQTTVEINPTTSFANVSSRFTINITVVNVQDLYAVEVTLNWNSSVLTLANVDIRMGQPDGVLYGTPFIPPASNVTQPGYYSLAATAEAPALPFNGTGNVVKITFEVIAPGTSPLDLESQLYNYNRPNPSQPIDHTTISGIFGATVPEIPSNVIGVALLILSMFAVVTAQVSRKNRNSSFGKRTVNRVNNVWRHQEQT